MGSVVKNLRYASLRSALQRCGALRLSPSGGAPEGAITSLFQVLQTFCQSMTSTLSCRVICHEFADFEARSCVEGWWRKTKRKTLLKTAVGAPNSSAVLFPNFWHRIRSENSKCHRKTVSAHLWSLKGHSWDLRGVFLKEIRSIPKNMKS